MSRSYTFGDSTKLYFISFAVVYWIDLFIRNEYKQLLLESWRYTQHEKGLEIYGWYIMTSHVRMIVGSKARPLDKIIGETKSYTSRMLRKAMAEQPAESRREWMTFMMEHKSYYNN